MKDASSPRAPRDGPKMQAATPRTNPAGTECGPAGRAPRSRDGLPAALTTGRMREREQYCCPCSLCVRKQFKPQRCRAPLQLAVTPIHALAPRDASGPTTRASSSRASSTCATGDNRRAPAWNAVDTDTSTCVSPSSA